MQRAKINQHMAPFPNRRLAHLHHVPLVVKIELIHYANLLCPTPPQPHNLCPRQSIHSTPEDFLTQCSTTLAQRPTLAPQCPEDEAWVV